MDCTYVQHEVSMALNKNIKSVAVGYVGYETMPSGICVHLSWSGELASFHPKGLEDLNHFYRHSNPGTAQTTGNCTVTFTAVTDSILQVRVGEVTDRSCFEYTGTVPETHITDSEEVLSLTTPLITLSFIKKETRFLIQNKENQILFEECVDASSIYHGYYYPPLSRLQVDGMECVSQSFKRSHDEEFYGFGEQFLDLSKKGAVVDIWNEDPANTLSYKSYLNIPFFISTKCYGFLLNSACRAWFDMGSKSAQAWNLTKNGNNMAYHLIFANDMSGVLAQYHGLTGTPALPPKWSFGLWMSSISRYQNDQAMQDIAIEIRTHGLPCDVLHIDPPWMGIDNLVCGLEWGANFARHKLMIEKLKQAGYKLCLWIAPYVPVGSSLYAEGIDGGFLLTDASGKVIVNKGPMNFWSPAFAYIDFTNPDATRWFKNRIVRLAVEGVQVIKTDLGELGPIEARYHNGMEGEEGHNAYPLAYARATYEALQEVHKNDALIWCRSGHIGSHQYPVHWGGDTRCDYENMRGQLRAILGAGISGFPFFSHDIGGFSGTPSPALYIRWFQFGMFTSHARCHGPAPHEPWHYGEEARTICLQFARLRYSLLPHIFSSAVSCCQNSQPMVKALVLAYPHDPQARYVDDAYIFCEDFYVAPMFTGAGDRKLYLPQGQWFDYWTGTAYTGGTWINYYCDLTMIPLFVREDAIIFTADVVDYIDNDAPYIGLTATLYPKQGGVGRVYFTDVSFGSLSYTVTDRFVTVTCQDMPSSINIKVAGGMAFVLSK